MALRDGTEALGQIVALYVHVSSPPKMLQKLDGTTESVDGTEMGQFVAILLAKIRHKSECHLPGRWH